MVVTRSQKRRKVLDKPLPTRKRTRSEPNSITTNYPEDISFVSTFDEMENLNNVENQDGAWGGTNNNIPAVACPPGRLSQTPASMMSYTDNHYDEDQERIMREMIGLPPRSVASSSNQTPIINPTPISVNTSSISSNLTPSAPVFTPQTQFNNATTSRPPGFPTLNPLESSTDVLLRALLVKLDAGFSNLNTTIRKTMPAQNNMSPAVTHLNNLVSNLNSQLQNLSKTIRSI